MLPKGAKGRGGIARKRAGAAERNGLFAIVEDDGPNFDTEAILRGTLDVESAPGKGATVYIRIRLPVL